MSDFNMKMLIMLVILSLVLLILLGEYISVMLETNPITALGTSKMTVWAR